MKSLIDKKFVLLSRDQFREFVFSRDKHLCVICKQPAKDAHHILERRLFSDGGYYGNNGASLCSECHLKAEMTLLSVEEIRKACGIHTDKIIPDHLYADQPYDKWGNPILVNGMRAKGELFGDPSVQKILEEGKVLHLFTKYIKYPRTYHLPWSPGASDDDRTLKSTDHFKNKEVVVTEKLDGENTTFLNDYIHARSINDKKHWSRSWIKNLHSTIAHDIPEDMRIVVENLFAVHSISYTNLESYCYAISAWKDLTCLDWDATLEWFALLGLISVPVLYRGVWNEDLIRSLHKETRDGNQSEGYVVRLASEFQYRDFSKSVAKFVRKDHVTSDEHWFSGRVGNINNLKGTQWL